MLNKSLNVSDFIYCGTHYSILDFVDVLNLNCCPLCWVRIHSGPDNFTRKQVCKECHMTLANYLLVQNIQSNLLCIYICNDNVTWIKNNVVNYHKKIKYQQRESNPDSKRYRGAFYLNRKVIITNVWVHVTKWQM